MLKYPAYSAAVRLLATKPSDDPKYNNSDHTTGALRWLDIGTGSGLLASLVAAAAASSSPIPTTTTTALATVVAITAADTKKNATPTATSTKVYACEGVEEVADVAAKTFDKNRVGVRLFRGRSTEMEVGRDLPSRVPRVISELLGTGRLAVYISLDAWSSVEDATNWVLMAWSTFKTYLWGWFAARMTVLHPVCCYRCDGPPPSDPLVNTESPRRPCLVYRSDRDHSAK